MNMKEILKQHLSNRVQINVGKKVSSSVEFLNEFSQRHLQLTNRNCKVIKSRVKGEILDIQQKHKTFVVSYMAFFKDVLQQKESIWVEEYEEQRQAIIEDGKIQSDQLLPIGQEEVFPFGLEAGSDVRQGFNYDRHAAVQYAERWWNTYNPNYEKFEVDCTNFISQCLHAGGATMSGYPSRSKGWWMKNGSWSYSWSVAHALQLYLGNANNGLRAVQKENVKDLMLGDVIFYDFEGDGRYNHSTIVVAKDSDGMPLVNAHTYNSRMRYWAYEDSTAYTPNIKYKFFHIVDDERG
jgi:hypothetical protein